MNITVSVEDWQRPIRRAAKDADTLERLRRFVAVDDKGCWVWQGHLRSGTGYGSLTIDGVSRLAHRVSYEALVAPIPDGLQIDHLCRNRACCNPAHLEPVTPLINTRRSPLTHGAKTHCPQGHPYAGKNLYEWGGRRACRTCRARHMAEYHARQKDGAAA